MLKGMEGSAAEGNFGLLNIYNPMDVFRRPVVSNEFLFQPAPTGCFVLQCTTLAAIDIII